MGRDMLRVDGVAPETMQRLKASANRIYGAPNASLLVRALISDHLAKAEPSVAPLTVADAGDTVRVELRLPKSAFDKVTEVAENRFSARNYYLTSVILSHLAQPQLQGDEIETLRRSNYEISKIGTNLNQIARAFNILVKAGEAGKLPELGKRIAGLRREITEHTSKVLRVLNAGTAVWEARAQKGRLRAKK
jgi:hypothetical protein